MTFVNYDCSGTDWNLPIRLIQMENELDTYIMFLNGQILTFSTSDICYIKNVIWQNIKIQTMSTQY